MGSTLEAKRELATYRGTITEIGTGPLVADTETGEIDIGTANAVIVRAVIAGSPSTGSFVSLTGSLETGGTFIAHNNGTNIKTSATTSSYTCVFKELPRYVKLKADWTDGNITVHFQPMQL